MRRQLLRRGLACLPDRWKRQLKTFAGVPSVEASLQQMKRNGFDPRAAIDVGAYSGEWTRLCKLLFPHVRVLMIEPQPARLLDLQRTASDLHEVTFAPVLVGETSAARVPLYLKETASSVLKEAGEIDPPYDTVPPDTVELPMLTLNDIVRQRAFPQPHLLKLDVQGYELAVLRGASELLPGLEAILVEVNLIPIYQGAALHHELVGFLASHDFYLYDICTFYRRPLDGALWQFDAIFVHSSSPLRSSVRWA